MWSVLRVVTLVIATQRESAGLIITTQQKSAGLVITSAASDLLLRNLLRERGLGEVSGDLVG